MKNRTPKQCRGRWVLINPSLKKGEWSAEEKEQLILIMKTLQAYRNNTIDIEEVVKRLQDSNLSVASDSKVLQDIKEQKTWVVAEALLNRSGTICLAMWRQKLDDTKKRGSLSVEEIALMLKGIHKYGEKYSVITQHFLPHRISTTVGTRWTSMKFKFENLFLANEKSTREEMYKKDQNYNFGKRLQLNCQYVSIMKFFIFIFNVVKYFQSKSLTEKQFESFARDINKYRFVYRTKMNVK
jgi:hypothetical protein